MTNEQRTYRVTWHEIHTAFVDVQASSEEDAIQQVERGGLVAEELEFVTIDSDPSAEALEDD